MRIAIIEDNISYQNVLKDKIDEYNINNLLDKIEPDFFIDSTDFGTADLPSYKIIIANVYLPSIIGTKLMDGIKDKTDADLALMSSKNGWVSEDIKKDIRIKTFIDKKDPNNIISWLRYMQSRRKIKMHAQDTQNRFDTLAENMHNIK